MSRASLVVMQYEAADPVYVRLLGPDAIVFAPDPVPNLVQQTGLSVTHTDLRRCVCFPALGGTIINKCLIWRTGRSYSDPLYSLVTQKKSTLPAPTSEGVLPLDFRGYYNLLKCLILGQGSCMLTQHTAL